MCEYAYIVNLDSGCLEFWRGFQKKLQPGNRYGETTYDGPKYYPCALLLEIPLTELKSAARATKAMREAIGHKGSA